VIKECREKNVGINVAHGVVVSSRKSQCRGKTCQEGKPREEIIASSTMRYISLI
jgi:hypothetical protein